MKGIMKLFPVAVAALTLASCANDDLSFNGEKAQAVNLQDGQILVTVDDEVATRAAFGEWQNATDNYIYRSIYWTEGDALKLYDDKNWKPQTYEYSSEATTKFVPNTDDVNSAVFTLAPTSTQTDDGQYENGYAVYPASLAMFNGELRSEILFDFSSLAVISAEKVEATEAKATSDGVTAWKTAMPMWGNISDKKLGLKRITGFLRLDLNNMDVNADRTYIVVESDQPLWGDFKAENFDYEGKKAPVVVYDGTPAAHTALTASDDIYTSVGRVPGITENDEQVIVIELPKVSTKANFFYVPIPLGLHTLNIYQHNNYDVDAPASFNLTAAEIAAPIFTGTQNVAEATFIRIDKGVEGVAGTPVTPEQLAAWIKKYDAIGSNISFECAAPIKVKNNDEASTQNYLLDLSNYQLKNEVTVNLTGGIIKSSDYVGDVILTVKTKAGSAPLNLNVSGEGAGTAIDKLVLGEDVKSKVVIAGGAGGTDLAPALVEVKNNNLVTWKANATKIELTGKMTIDGVDKTIARLDAKGTNDAIDLNNGTITALNHNSKGLTVASKGKSFIKDIKAINNNDWTTPSYKAAGTNAANWYSNVTLTSTWDGVKYATTDFAPQQYINTAAQFSIGGYVENTELHTAMTIEGAWVGNDIAQNFNGLNNAITLSINDRELAATNLLGLFRMIDGSSNIVKVEKVNLTAKIELPAEWRAFWSPMATAWTTLETYATGALAGGARGTNAITIDNVKVNANNPSNVIGYTSENAQTSGNIGGLIGCVGNGTFIITNTTVKGKIQGFQNLGGLIGYVDNKAIVNIAGAKADGTPEGANTVNVSFTELYPFTSSKSSAYAGTIGSLVGSVYSGTTAANAAKINIYPGNTVTDNVTANIAALKFNKNYYSDEAVPVATNYYYTGSSAGEKNLIGYINWVTTSDAGKPVIITKRTNSTTGKVDAGLDRAWTNNRIEGGSDFTYNIYSAQ